MNIYEEILQGITNRFTVDKIEKKIVNGEELTEEEKDNYLQYLYEKAKESIKDYNLNKKPGLSLKIVSIAGKIIGGEAKAYATALDTAAAGIKTNKKNNLELLKGITITSNNMSLENLQILSEQSKTIDAYLDAFEEYTKSFIERTKNYKQDFTDVGKEELETMTRSKTKIKELSKKYKKSDNL